MPLHIDPQWEYRQDPPEILEAVYGRAARGLECLSELTDLRARDAGVNPGLRFGRRGRSIDRPNLFLAPVRPCHAAPRPLPAMRECRGCGDWFRPERKGQPYCGGECYSRVGVAGRKRVLPDVACATCGRAFRPPESKSVCCSVKCSGMMIAAARREIRQPDASVVERCAAMYAAGMRVADIAAALGLSVPTVKRYRRRSGVASRPVGQPRKAGAAS